MGKVKKASYKKKWGGENDPPVEPAVVPAPAPAPAPVAADKQPAPDAAKPTFGFTPSAALAGVTGTLTSIGNGLQTQAQGFESKLVNVDAGLKEKVGDFKGRVGELTKQFEGKFEAVKNVVTGEATGAAPAAPAPQPGGGKRRRTRKRTAKRKSHKRKRTHKRKKSHKRRK